MKYKKKGYPEEDDLVICTVKTILPHSVFVSLDEYKDREGMIHISEVAPGRIRNLGDYVKVDKRIVCKVLRVDTQRGHIDLSLRRVNNFQYRSKNAQYSLETRAEKVLEALAQKEKTTLEKIYAEFGEKIMENYGSLNACFEEAVYKGEEALASFVPSKYLKPLVQLVQERIKMKEKKVDGVLEIRNGGGDGIEKIKEVLLHAQDLAKSKKYNVFLSYISAPRYALSSTAFDYATANSHIKEIAEVVLKQNKAHGGTGTFTLKEKK